MFDVWASDGVLVEKKCYFVSCKVLSIFCSSVRSINIVSFILYGHVLLCFKCYIKIQDFENLNTSTL